MSKKRSEGQPPPVMRVAPLGELKAYVVTEEELERLARGSATSILLNISYALIPVAITFFVTLLSTTVSETIFIIFVCSIILFALAGGICLIVGWKTSESNQVLLEKIKNRMPPPPAIQQGIADQGSGTDTASVQKGE